MISESHINTWTEKEGILHATVSLFNEDATACFISGIQIIEKVKMRVNKNNKPETDGLAEFLTNLIAERAINNDDVLGGFRHRSYNVGFSDVTFNVLH